MQAWKARLKDGWNITLLESDGGWIGHLRNARTRDEKVLGPYPTVQEAKEKAISDASRSGGVAPATLPVEWRNAFHSSSTVRLLEAERQGNRWRFASVISVVMGIAAAIASLLATLPSTHFNTRDSEIDRQLAAVRLQTAENQARMMAFLQSNSSRPDDIKMAQQLTALQDEMRGLNAKVANYEAALGDDPAKKLALPLLRKDMDTLKDEHKADVTALHEEMARTFDIMKWLLGVLGVGSVLSGLANWRLGRIPKGDEKP